MRAACEDEAGIGPASSCRPMDFTLGFEFRILSILPSTLFLAIALLCIVPILRSIRITNRPFDVLALCKLAFPVLATAILVATLVCLPETGWRVWAARAYALELAAMITFAIVSYAHHTRCQAPSSLLATYALLSLLFSATQLRTFVQLPDYNNMRICLAVLVGIRTVVLLAELAPKRRLLRPEYKPLAREQTSSLLARLFFVYLLNILIRGFRQAFTLDDVVAFGIPPDLVAASAGEKFRKALAKKMKTKSRTFPMIRPTIRAFWRPICTPVLPKLALIAATFAQAYLVNAMLAFVDASYDGENVHGWALVGAYVLVYAVIAGGTSIYWDEVYTMVVTYRAALVSALFDKSLRLSAATAEAERGAAITYVNVDTERVCEGIAYLHETWSALLSIVIAAVILWFEASYAMFPPIAAGVLFFVITSAVGKRVARSQKAWMGATQHRVKVLSSIMTQILPLKFLGAESAIPPWIRPLRESELDALKEFFNKLNIVGVLSTATINVAGLSALGTYVGINDTPLRPEKLFTILTVVNLLTNPISIFGNCFPLLLASYASLRRIGVFLWRSSGKGPWHKVVDEALSERTSIVETTVELQDADVAVHTGGRAILMGIDLVISRASLTVVVGPVGAGKTFLLKTLLGETHILSGSVTRPKHRVAYAPQEAFVWPGTLRENIGLSGGSAYAGVPLYEADTTFMGEKTLSGSESFRTDVERAKSEFQCKNTRDRLDFEWYETVLDACALRPDLADLPPCISANTVSGGQRQRISLARAVYSRSDILLLDDCFSASDAHTASLIFENLFSPTTGLLRDKTVVLVTHNLQHVNAADRVVVLDKGVLVAHGTPEELRTSQLDLARYIGDDSESDNDEEGIQEGDLPKRSATEETEQSNGNKKGRKSSKTVPATVVKKDDEEEGVHGPTSWAPYLFYLRACGWNRLSVWFVLQLVFIALSVGLQVMLEEWSESDTTNHGPWLGGYAAFTVASFLTSFLMLYMYTQRIVPHASHVIHIQQLLAVLRAPITYFQQTPLARLQNRWAGDMFMMDFPFPRAVLDFVVTGVRHPFRWPHMLVSATRLPCESRQYVVCYCEAETSNQATSRQLQRHTMASKTPLQTAFTSTLTGIVAIRAFHAQPLFKDMVMHHLDRSQVPMYYRYAGIRFLRTMLYYLTAAIAILLAVLAVALRGSTSGGYLGVALSQLVNLAQLLINLLLAYTRVENGVVSVERLFELDRLTPEDSDGHDPGSSWPSCGRVEFKNVSMRYSTESANVLNDINFTLDGGKKLGICGRTGSGKSSTVFTLLRGLGSSDLFKGQILIDGIDITTIHVHRLRSSISTVSQDPFLLYATVKDNLTIGCTSDVGDDQIWDALERVGMREAVAKLEGKLDATLSADGLQFSAGERQLLCMARVLLQKRKIVVLDEASSSMDPVTDQKMLTVLREDLQGVTVIAVAHRISTIVDYDEVIVLSGGRVLESGRPDVLLQNPSSHFTSLYKRQSS
ncbi:P-loop containing nucleoside triphosphate hydrolase protein [Fistulina hepatica ATCC 64428]|uniref:p-loop containing nucleoside triphosphate hydrolase protein n=1 Tax=Fistulina hepatica ATCC 64428 TaxID=1128425 RepID=A0A0D7AA26_9AGAR|nr:P-loop containing nucleoside triphosphate hydrolase protein [Fistulina hepatica ATCC 64428]